MSQGTEPGPCPKCGKLEGKVRDAAEVKRKVAVSTRLPSNKWRYRPSPRQPAMPDISPQALRQEFDLHVAHLTDTHKAFIENTSKVAGFLLLALGWFATSKDARTFLASTPNCTALAALAVTAAYLLWVGASWITYRVSLKTFRRLQELAYLPQSAYEARALGPVTFGACIAGNGVLTALLVNALLNVPTAPDA